MNYYGDLVPHWYAYPPKSSYVDADPQRYDELDLSTNSGVNVYIHIPFCNVRCNFCSLFTTVGATHAAEHEYVQHLVREINSFSSRFPKATVASLYFGGGTPSVLSAQNIDEVMYALELIGVTGTTPKSVEFSPETTGREQLASWRRHGFERASLGIQSFNNDRLKKLGRHHSAEAAARSIEQLSNAGFVDINADLIFGHEDQTLNEWEYDLTQVLSIPASGCTFHPLAVQSKTAFERRAVRATQSSAQRTAKHRLAFEIFAADGWVNTSSISFARAGRANPLEKSEASGIPTVGFGAGARTYARTKHLSTLPSSKRLPFGEVLRAYFKAVSTDQKPAMSEISLSAEERVRRGLILNLHHGSLDQESIDKSEKLEITRDVPHVLSKFVSMGYLEHSSNGLLVTPFGASESGQMGALLASAEVRASLDKKLHSMS